MSIKDTISVNNLYHLILTLTPFESSQLIRLFYVITSNNGINDKVEDNHEDFVHEL
jgi:hypothetical protein